ncbi:MAG: cell division protein ZapA [Deltaproteobacteria bacterium]|jgi:cell division protein ZapA|nr:cell division protein ZapA [Deltaproteobacteria bacterium]
MISSQTDLTKKRDSTSKDGHTYDFLIAGLPYKLKTNLDDATVQELVGFINLKMEQSLQMTKNGSYQSAAILTALNLAEELIILKRKAHRELEKVEEKILKLSNEIENSKKN